MVVSACKFSHERTCLCTARHIISYVWARPTCFHEVPTTRRVHVRVRTLKDGCVHTFLTYEVMSLRNFKNMTPCLSHNFALETKYHITTF